MARGRGDGLGGQTIELRRMLKPFLRQKPAIDRLGSQRRQQLLPRITQPPQHTGVERCQVAFRHEAPARRSQFLDPLLLALHHRPGESMNADVVSHVAARLGMVPIFDHGRIKSEMETAAQLPHHTF